MKEKFEFAEYLEYPHDLNRTTMTHLRLSAHNLGVEVNRRKKEGDDDVRCIMCASDGEDEMHIFQCPANENFRKINGINVKDEIDLLRLLKRPNIQTMTYASQALELRRRSDGHRGVKRKERKKAQGSEKIK